MNEVNLGDKVKDSITGFSGVVVGVTTWLHGCRRITVLPDHLDKEGKLLESQMFDEPQLVLIKAKKVKAGDPSTGGPIPKQTQKGGVSKY